MLKKLPKNMPPIVVVQHISPEFSSSFAFRMSQISGLRDGFQDLNPGSAESKSILLEDGCIYIAKGDYHLNLARTKDGIAIEKNFNRKTNGHRPSIDVLFESIPVLGIESMAVILTGMGQDGALGLLKLAKSDKCFTMAQDEQSSVVYGMPKKALESGAACYVGNILELRTEMLKRLGRR
jgi:two-component system chemotaxis response regulator CheB